VDHRFRGALLLVFIFAILGPPIGAVVVLFVTSVDRGSFGVFLEPGGYLLVAMHAYLFGGVPAFLTGLLAAIGRLSGGEVPALALAPFGAGGSLVFSSIFLETYPLFVAAAATAGAIAAVLCHYLGRAALRALGAEPIGRH
jgi:hypothetical protein